MYNNTYGGAMNQWNKHWQKCAIEQRKKGKKCPISLALSTYTRKPSYAELLELSQKSNYEKLHKKSQQLQKKYFDLQKRYDDTVKIGTELLNQRDNSINILENRFDNAAIEYDRILEDNNILQHNLDVCDQDFENIQQQLKNTIDEYNEIAAKYLKQSEEYIHLVDSFNELEDRYNQLLDENINYQDMIDMKIDAIKHLEKEIEFGNNRLAEIEQDRDLIIEKYDSKEDEINRLLNLLSSKDVPEKQMKKDLNTIKKANEEIENDLKESLNNLDEQEKIIISTNNKIHADIEKLFDEIEMPIPKILPSLKNLEIKREPSSEFEPNLFEKKPSKAISKKSPARKYTDAQLNKIYKSRKQLTRDISTKLTKADLGYLHNKCLGLSRASWAGKEKGYLVDQYNKCIKSSK